MLASISTAFSAATASAASHLNAMTVSFHLVSSSGKSDAELNCIVPERCSVFLLLLQTKVLSTSPCAILVSRESESCCFRFKKDAYRWCCVGGEGKEGGEQAGWQKLNTYMKSCFLHLISTSRCLSGNFVVHGFGFSSFRCSKIFKSSNHKCNISCLLFCLC